LFGGLATFVIGCVLDDGRLVTPGWLAFGLSMALASRWGHETATTPATGELSADRSGLTLDGRPLAVRAELAVARYCASTSPWVDVTLTSGLSIRVQVDNETQGLALVEALELDPGRHVARFTTADQGTIAIGADGILFGAGERWFIRAEDLQGAEQIAGGRSLRLHFADAEPVTIETDLRSDTASRREGEVPVGKLVCECIAKALAHRRERPSLPELEVVLSSRHGGSQQWLASLRDLIAPGVYRSGSAPVGELHQVLRSPNASPRARLGAAVALMAQSSQQGDSVRLAAEAVAHPGLRSALEQVAAATSDRAILRALGRLAS